MSRKLRILCTILLCGALFTSECMQISISASAADLREAEEPSEKSEEEELEEAEEEPKEEPEGKKPEEAPAEDTEEEPKEVLPQEAEKEKPKETLPEEMEKETPKKVPSLETPSEELNTGELDETLPEEPEEGTEKEDPEEEPEEAETVTILFDAAYGSGTYLLSGEDDEWLTAEGDVTIELPEEESLTLQVRADEGCFMVSEDGDRVYEMEIEVSADNKEEFEGFTVRFETAVTGSVELGDSSGVLGSEFTAQVHIEENVDTEGMRCKWIYEEEDVVLLTEDSVWGEDSIFKVAAAKERTAVIGAEIYRQDILLGTMPEAEYQISEVDAGQFLNVFTLIIDEDMEIDLLSEGESVAGGELNFYVELNREYIESLDHEVEEVKVSYLSNEDAMEEEEEGIFSQTIAVEEASLTKAQPVVTVTLEGDIEIVITAQKTLQIDKDAPVVNISLVDGESVIQKEWLSRGDGYENLQMKIDVEDLSGIKSCKVSSDEERGYRISKTEDSYYMNLSLKERVMDYRILVEDQHGNVAEVSYTVKVDNTAPSEEVEVSFVSEEEIVCEEEIAGGYVLGEGSGDICSGNHITVSLAVEDGAGRGKTASGIKEVQAAVIITTREGTDERRYTLEPLGEGEERLFSLCIDSEASDPEMTYQIKEIYIEDHAENSVTLSEEEGCIDEVRYVVDHRKPAIQYTYPQGIKDKEEEEILYFERSVTGRVEIQDLNLAAYEVTVKDAPGYGGAEISRTEEGDSRAVYTFALKEDGEYRIDTTLKTDAAFLSRNGFVTEQSTIMIVDTQAPVIEMKLSGDGGGEYPDYADQYYKENLHADILVKEKNVDLVEVRVFCNGSVQTAYTAEDFLFNEKKDGCTLSCALTEEGEYYLEAVCRDKTGKQTEFKSNLFTIDKTLPKVTLTYDNNEAKNEFYYNDARTATIKVEDAALDKESIIFKVETRRDQMPVLSAWTEELTAEGKLFTAQVTFEKDDIYDVSFQCSDLAGNSSEVCDGGHFVIDTASPVVSIVFDHSGGKNEIYYNQDRTARITVEDLSFDKDAFTVSNKEGEDMVSVRASDAFAGTEWKYTTEIACSEEGIYEFSVQAQDLAGNEAVVVNSERFIIDKTPPEIEITGILNESANKGDVIPVITYRDKYLDDEQSDIAISGYKNGILAIEPAVRADKESRSAQFDAFPRERQMDDIYTLTVHIEDKAGNQSEEEYLFSVNRFGSTFGIDKATARLVEDYYTNAEQDIVITETNVDALQKEEIMVSFNGEPKTLREGRDYRVAAQGSSATWKAYTYTIYKENFAKEGQYVVTVFSQDAAQNQSDNNVQDLEIAFAVDKTAPSIVVTNLEDHGVYDQNDLTFYVDVQDNMYLQGMQLFINDEEVQSYEREELTGAVSYRLEATGEPMDITVTAVDAVGNLGEKQFRNIVLGEMIKAIEEEDTALSDTPQVKMVEQTVKGRMTGLYIGVFAMAAAVAVLVALVIALRKKKEIES